MTHGEETASEGLFDKLQILLLFKGENYHKLRKQQECM